MAIQKQNLNLNFSSGLDTKTDPFQVSPGKFLALQNTIFQKGGLLQKRNGYAMLTSLPDATTTTVTTFNGNLTALSQSLNAYSQASASWVNKGNFQPLRMNTLPLIRTTNTQTQADATLASNGLICTVFTDTPPSGTTYNYAVADSTTGQIIVPPTAIVPTSGTVNGSPRLFILNGFFVVVYSTSTNHLQYVAINIGNPTATVATASDITTSYTGVSSVAFDGVVANNTLYLAWNGNDGGGAIRMTFITSSFTQGTTITGNVVAAGKSCTVMSVCADITQSTPVIWVSFYTTTGTTGYSLAVNPALASVLTATQIINANVTPNITSSAQNGSVTVFYEITQAMPYDASIPNNIINKRNLTQAGSLSAAQNMSYSVGLASKSFIIAGSIYMLVAYSSPYQPTYFLINSSGNVIAKLAYSNGAGYLTKGLPSVTVSGTTASLPYLLKDMITAVNKNTNVPAGTQVNGIYAQIGINLAQFNFSSTNLGTAEIGANLNLSGGFLWSYDGSQLVEQNFHLWPDLTLNVDGTYHGLTTNTAGGNLTDQKYFYVATYEWSDNQGNLFRSAPSIPVSITTAGGNTSTNTIKVPCLNLTYKTNVKIVVYRWSTAQQVYYQVTSVSVPTLNVVTGQSVTITDTFADATILGNSILYTTGGVVEDIGPPATSAMTLYKSRLFLVDAEDQNLMWFSKQVIESTPVEMSDLFTIYVAPTLSAQGNTGPITALSALDDKLIIFKKNAIYYLVGNGPDNTGANNDFSDPVFITSTVGCSNPSSIVFMPNGLMFQSDKGIWLLGRDLSTTYIGAPVEQYNAATVQSAVNVPGTNQVRFTLSTGITLMYDYFFQQWGSFVGVPAISSTLYQNLHTFINSYGQVFQESPGTYLDGSNPVLMSFTTSWLNLAGLQGYERAYFFYLLATYLSPHKLNIQIAYDYQLAPTQNVTISPNNFSSAYGLDPVYGSAAYFGGRSSKEQWRVFFHQQKCESFQITLNELFDSTLGVSAGAGFTLSGLDLVIGAKSTYPRIRAAKAVG